VRELLRLSTALLVLSALAAPAAADDYAGRPLAEVLRELSLPIVFTSELVGPELVVAEEPPPEAALDPRRLLDAVLAPHGLAVREAPGGVLVVVRATPASGGGLAGGGETGDAEAIERIYVRDEIVVRPSRLSVLFERPDSPIAVSREEIDSLPHLGGDLFRRRGSPRPRPEKGSGPGPGPRAGARLRTSFW
jgi:hypothetical protein